MADTNEERRLRLIELRTALGFSQKEFAAGLNISPTHICSLESGKRRVTDRFLRGLSHTYGANARYLEKGEGAMFDNFEEARLHRVTENFKKLDALLQEYILKQIDLVLEVQDKLDKRGKEELS
jgi:transcriptional regulator with XRE-family HTH domain